jgi:undecaprenyl-diphosphatase
MSLWEAIILAIIEGITEFLPVSSTGHMIIGSSLMGIEADDFVKNYTVIIQFGAILSVLVMYSRRFLRDFSFYIKLAVGFLPAGVFGFLLNDYIDALLENVTVVGVSLFLGGVFLLFVDQIFARNETHGKTEVSWADSLFIGFFQVLAMIPGVSRSAATITGGLARKLTRKAAAEFSFFLAVPTMFAASAYKLLGIYKKGGGFTADQLEVLVVGNAVAFLVAMLAIKFFIEFLSRYGFKWFGWYRIVLGAAIIGLYLAGYDLQIV